MAFELGFLVGSLALLAFVLYYTRVRSPAVPHAGNVSEVGESSAGPATEVCDICERERVCSTEGDLTICAECSDDLMA